MSASNTSVQVADFKLDASRLRCCTEPLRRAIYLSPNNMAPAGLYEPSAAPYPAASLKPNYRPVRRSSRRASFYELVRPPAGIDWQAHWPQIERRSSSRKSGQRCHYILRAAPHLLDCRASYSASSRSMRARVSPRCCCRVSRSRRPSTAPPRKNRKLRCPLLPLKRPIAALPRNDAMCH